MPTKLEFAHGVSFGMKLDWFGYWIFYPPFGSDFASYLRITDGENYYYIEKDGKFSGWETISS